MTTTLSVVIACRNQSELLAACLESLEAQGVADLEVVVVDDASDDPGMTDLARATAGRVRWVRGEAWRGADGCRNEGAGLATGRYLAFVDADCRVAPGWALALMDALESGADAVTGPVLPARRSFVAQLAAVAEFGENLASRPGRVSNFATCNVALDRQFFLEAGGFPEGEVGGDRLLSWRLFQRGALIHFQGDMVVSHDPCQSAAAFLSRRKRYALYVCRSRRLDPSLPGGWCLFLGPLAGLAWSFGRFVRDLGRLHRALRRLDRSLLLWPVFAVGLLIVRLLEGWFQLFSGEAGK